MLITVQPNINKIHDKIQSKGRLSVFNFRNRMSRAGYSANSRNGALRRYIFCTLATGGDLFELLQIRAVFPHLETKCGCEHIMPSMRISLLALLYPASRSDADR